MLSVSEVAKQLNVTDRTVRNWIESGLLIGYKLGQSYRIKEDDFQKFVENSRVSNEKSQSNNE